MSCAATHGALPGRRSLSLFALAFALLSAGLVCASRAAAQLGQPIEPLAATGTITYFIADGDGRDGFRATDVELATWALRAWEREIPDRIRFEPTDEDGALIRIYFVPAGYGQYGETRTVSAAGQRGAAVFVRPDTDGLGEDIGALAREDSLWRDTIVYLTCVHELGHALGLRHTAEFADIMYSFQFGGDIPAFFRRYRERLETRADIATTSGLSAGDIEQLTELYRAPSPDAAP
jgi:Matrixin